MIPLLAAAQAVVLAAAVAHGINPEAMGRLINCESRFDRYARNGQYVGIAQLGNGMQTYFHIRGFTDIYDPAEQANFTADVILEGGIGNWPVCGPVAGL